AFAARVHLVDGDDLARLWIGEQVLVMEAPPRGRVAAERLALVLGIRARPRLHVDDADLEDVAGHRALHGHRPRADVHAEPLARAASEEGRLHRPRAAPVDAFALAIPVINALRARVALDHPLAVVVRMMRERLDRHEITGSHLDQGLEQLVYVAPLTGSAC